MAECAVFPPYALVFRPVEMSETQRRLGIPGTFKGREVNVFMYVRTERKVVTSLASGCVKVQRQCVKVQTRCEIHTVYSSTSF